ncbi:chromate transporter [Acidaminobacter sp. JC074]|uniref:chromate transporter n=1 Tax=Acidaminobacter sp. JC074 TaxID=2530199 RepID=UPI001F0EA157|nr:chromate transporter [Acidaminobacter sp. JC074]MCH4886648.1 chromate transporter [Acidaminobacter sp. JC074]
MKVYLDLFMAFFRCGIFAFGGGPATVPLIENEAVNTFQWLSVAEFGDAYAVVSTLPGPITTKMAALIGYKMGGVLGSVIAIIGIVLPSAIAVVVLFSFYQRNKDAKWMQGMMKGVRPVVAVLLFQVFYKMAKSAFGLTAFNLRYASITGVVALVAAIMLFKFKIHPIVMIVLSLIFGGIFLG